MKFDYSKTFKLLSKIPLLVVVLLVFMAGYLFKGLVSTAPPESTTQIGETTEVEDEIWTCSMHPQIRLPKPGKCPMCGMDLVQVEEDGGGEDAGPRTLTLSPTAQKLAEVQVAPVERKFVTAEIRMVGKIDYDETRVGHITAWIPGRLDRLFVDYTGVPVKKGDHMVYLYSPELRSGQVDLLEAIRTAETLKKSSIASIRESAPGMVDDVRKRLSLWGLTDEQIAEIEKRGKPSDHMTIYSPMGGIVVHKNALEGMYVQTGTRIYTIADLSRLWVKLDAYESDLAWLRYGQTVEFETEAYPGETFSGTVSFIDPVLDSKTRTVKVRVNVENPDGRLKPEMFVRAVARAKLAEGGLVVNTALAGKWIGPMHPEIVKDEPGPCDVCGMPLVRAETLGFVSPDDLNAKPPLVIPASAPLITGKRAVVYVELPDKPGTYQGREVTLGPRAGDYYLVYEGLAEGEQVVVNGNFKIDSAMQILARPSMMTPDTSRAAPAHHHISEAKTLEIPEAFRAQLKPMLAAYLQAQDALSHDKFPQAQHAAKTLNSTLDKLDMSLLAGKAHRLWMKESDGIKKITANIVAAKDIEKSRAAFALLSESMIAVAKRFGPTNQTLYQFHCPMAFNGRGADWLQDKNQTENPYFGSAMFRCGTVKETIGTKPAAKPKGGPQND